MPPPVLVQIPLHMANEVLAGVFEIILVQWTFEDEGNVHMEMDVTRFGFVSTDRMAKHELDHRQDQGFKKPDHPRIIRVPEMRKWIS